jgi:2'-5' RNA ligase
LTRLFVAAWPPDDVLDRLEALPRPEVSGVRWTTRRQWHVTLRFLGSCSVEDAVSSLSEVVAGATEAVAGPRSGRLGRGVLVLPVAGLDAVAASVLSATAGVGKPPEVRPFRGHLTLARLTGRARPAPIAFEARWPVMSVALVESRLLRTGAEYTTVAEVALVPSADA